MSALAFAAGAASWCWFARARFFQAKDQRGALSTLFGKPYLRDLECRGKDESTLLDAVRRIVPGASDVQPKDVEIKPISGGITNALFSLSFRSGIKTVLLRIFGAEGMIDRDIENPTFEALTRHLGVPEYYGRFANGRIEGMLVGYRALETDEMSSASISVEIARNLARMHKFCIPKHLRQFYQEPGLWKQIWLWFQQASEASTMARMKENAARDAEYLDDIDFLAAKAELMGLESRMKKTSPVAFCHNDLLAGNIMISGSTGEIALIDFEYGGVNYVAFDIANHFNEWAGGTDNAIPDYSKFPSAEQQRAFCSAYVDALQDQGESVSEEERLKRVDELLDDVSDFVLADHWYWGLWAINQARDETCEDFDYMLYAHKRIGRYFALVNKHNVARSLRGFVVSKSHRGSMDRDHHEFD